METLQFALRSLRQTPGFALVAILALALGIGANSAIFSIVNAIFLKPLPFADADAIVQLTSTLPDQRRRPVERRTQSLARRSGR